MVKIHWMWITNKRDRNQFQQVNEKQVYLISKYLISLLLLISSLHNSDKDIIKTTLVILMSHKFIRISIQSKITKYIPERACQLDKP